jgi:POT family proton-dependent oligopeptide transporter
MTAAPRFPRQLAYIIGAEGAERFSFYGMRNLLTTFLASSLLLDLPKDIRELAAKDTFHTFVIGVYFFPLLGGWLADRRWGKYATILRLSVVYTMGHAMLALSEGWKGGFYAGLLLIALGSGGIKPCVSSFVGDQFDTSNRGLAKLVFDAFYWIINFGSFFSTLLAPVLLDRFGPAVAFGLPGVLMAVATLVFWLGRDGYVRMPPADQADPDSFLAVSFTALRAHPPGAVLASLGAVLALAALGLVPVLGVVPSVCLGLVAVLGFGGVGTWWSLDRVRGKHPDEAIEGVRAVLRLLVVFALVTPFWSLFDQKASTWLFQANAMTRPEWFHPAQLQSLNPALVMALIPLNNVLLYPGLRRLGLEPTALRRMTAGIALAGVSWVVVAGLQALLDGGTAVHVGWQVVPYVIVTLGEVLVSTTGLEFAYSQAPTRMKGTLMSFWSLSVTVGNLWVLLVDAGAKGPTVGGLAASLGLSQTALLMLFFAGMAFVAAVLFGAYARRFPVVDRYRLVGAAA